MTAEDTLISEVGSSKNGDGEEEEDDDDGEPDSKQLVVVVSWLQSRKQCYSLEKLYTAFQSHLSLNTLILWDPICSAHFYA